MDPRLKCPVCSAGPFNTRIDRLDIPYFGEVYEFVYLCDACNFRRVDLHVGRETGPARYTLHVRAPEDLMVRVFRSAEGHFEIPELGVRAEPSDAADGFVTNVEGILDRCVSAIEMAHSFAEDDATRETAKARLELADRLRAVNEPWTIVLEDPSGNSAIVSEKAERTDLSPDDAARLRA